MFRLVSGLFALSHNNTPVSDGQCVCIKIDVSPLGEVLAGEVNNVWSMIGEGNVAV